jgi:hypothetical protein
VLSQDFVEAGDVIRYQGIATIRQGDAVSEGLCTIESHGELGPDPSWSGKLQDAAPTVNLSEGAAWLHLTENGREGEIVITRTVAGSGLVEFSGAFGISELR